MVVGLGAQAEREDEIPKIDDACLEFLREISARSPFIAVRGEYTARVCREFGITNVKVLGCPSILISADRELGRKISKRMTQIRPEPEAVAVHAACHKGALINVERELIRYVRLFEGSSYVVQRPPEMISALYQQELSDQETSYLTKIAPFFGFHEGVGQLTAFLRRHGYVPTSIDSWMTFLQRFSCCINTRIHGTIIPIQAGIPAVCVVHDTRTKELAERLKLPALTLQKFIETRYDIFRMFAATSFDGVAFDIERRRIAEEYVSLIRELKLTPSDHLLSFLQ